jgi:hypothetical protein
VADHVPYSDAELDELEQLDLAARAAPWGWFGNAGCHEVHLATPDRGRIYVMGFARWGMRGAQPVFQVKRSGIGLMEPAAGMLQFEVPYRKDIVGIDHPDARLIPAARNALPRLLAEVRRLRAEVARLQPGPRERAAEDVRQRLGLGGTGGNLVFPDEVTRG